jgi:hypothetical protein
MNIIQQNPYRITGLLVGATAREQERQIRRLKQFIEAEQEPQDDYSFPVFGDFDRTIDSVNEAASKLNLDGDKMNAALFWFYNGNEITDEPAFEAIKDGDTDTAIEIWKKLAYHPEDDSYNAVTKRNASAFHNLSTFYLQEYGVDEDTLQLKLLFLESDYFKELKSKATDETYKISKKEIQLLFLNGLIQEDTCNEEEILEYIFNIEFSAKNDFLKVFVQKPIERLERLINECKRHRKSKKEDVIVAGTNLYNSAKPILSQVQEVLGASDIKYINIADKISDEVLQCGIQLFNDYKENENYDPSEPAKKLFSQAKSLAQGNIVKQRCKENTEDLLEWIKDKPERDKQKRIEIDLKFVSDKLEKFQNLPNNVINAKNLIESCKPKLINIKSALGAYDEFYLKISSAIANNALGMLIETVNKEQNSPLVKMGDFSNLRLIINSALEASNLIGTLDMLSQQRSHYSTNHATLKSISTQLTPARTSYSSPSSSSSTSSRPSSSPASSTNPSGGSSGCYIATMVYGDYDHPQVLVLRKFRDNVLDSSSFGKMFIKVYYDYSPKIVERLKNNRSINTIIRKILDQFIKFIK